MTRQLLAGQRVTVEAPATIANLGAGFDCLGLAIELRLRVDVVVRERGAGEPAVRLDVIGEGRGRLDPERGNRFVDAFRVGLQARGAGVGAAAGLDITMRNDIPLSRGLGSSGAATVAGLLAADALSVHARLPGSDDDALLAEATALEGHPDNVAPALLGGLVATATLDGGLTAYRLDPPPQLRVALFIPDRPTSTATMRAILPGDVPRGDAVATLGRAATAMAGLAAGDWGALRLLSGDRLHEPYRAAAYPELPSLITAAGDAGALMACLAGSGSTIAALTLDPDRAAVIAEAVAAAGHTAGLAGRSLVVSPSHAGAAVLTDAAIA